jgi:N utilization substance protein A
MVVVPDRQLSLAIGKEGQNARLAAKLTGWRIDIKSESEATAEGLDRVLVERAQRALSRGDDLLTRAERILREEGDTPADDRLRQAAQALDRLPQLPTEGYSIPAFTELPAFDSLVSKEKSKWDAALEEVGSAGGDESAETSDGALPEDWTLEPLAAELSEAPFGGSDEAAEELPDVEVESLELGIAASTELPEIITADMLRARRAMRKESTPQQDIEVPAELLVGLEKPEAPKDDWEEELEIERGKGKAKTKGKDKSKKVVPVVKSDKKSKKKWRPGQGDLEDFY